MNHLLSDHIAMSCRSRGKITGKIPFETSNKKGTVTLCACGFPAMPGEDFCYEHKHT